MKDDEIRELRTIAMFHTVILAVVVAVLIVIAAMLTGCTFDGRGPADVGGADLDDPGAAWDGCAPGPGTYSPWSDPSTLHPGPAAASTWDEGFEDFAPGAIECSSDKAATPSFDVTSGCLSAVRKGDHGQYGRARVDGDVVRIVTAAAWTSAQVRARWYHVAASAGLNYPGIKLFARYQTEDDLYVAGFRADGLAQIKRKLCGEYVTLAQAPFPFPAAGSWHAIQLEVAGDTLRLLLDDDIVLTATDEALSWGAAGIRVDSFDGSYLDDWNVR